MVSGLVSGHSTQDISVSLVEEWRETMDKENVVGGLFLNMSKAFDMVDHTILLGKPSGSVWYKREEAWSGLMNILMAEEAQVKRGVPQGSILE